MIAFARLSFPAAAMLVFVTVFAATAAQQPDEDPAGEPPAEEAEPPPGPDTRVTVTATRTPTPVSRLGQSLTVITAEEIEAQGARTVLQVLETVPGLSVVRSGSFGGAATIFVRGGEADFNLVLIDGVPVNQPGGNFDFGDITTSNVERIEVLRGPASVLYGADAAASVVNIITRRGEGRPTGSFSFEGGSFGSTLLRGDVSGSGGPFHYSLAAHRSETDGFYAFNNGYDRAELSASTTIDLGGASSLFANVRSLNSDYAFPTDFSGAVVDPNDFRTTDEIHYSAAYQGQLHQRYGTRLQYGYHRREFQNFTVFDGVDDFFDSVFALDEDRHFLDWQNNLQLGNHLLSAGFGYEREAEQNAGLSRQSLGVFLQEQFSWRDRLFLTAGLRFEDNDSFESFTSGKFSLGYRLTREFKLRGSVGNGFRAPAFTEILGFPEFGIAGNPNLRPEKNVATDLGVDYLQEEGLRGLSATVFFNRFSDLIEFTFLGPAGSPNYLNLEEARSRGMELDGFLVVAPFLRLGGHYTLTDTEVTDPGSDPSGSFEQGRPLLRRPRHEAGAFAEYLRRRYKLRIDFKFKGARDDVRFFPDFSSARVRLDSYWKTDFGVTIPLIGLSDQRGDVAVVFRGENVFDKQYTEVAGFESPGRSLFAGVELAF